MRKISALTALGMSSLWLANAPLTPQTEVPRVARLGLLSDYEKLGTPASPDGESAAGQFREDNITLNGLRFHYLEWGDKNAPAMLVIPGAGGGGGCAEGWTPFASAMRDRYHVYAMEQRGQCDSAWANEYTWQRVVEDIDAFVNAFHPAPVTTVGHSSGAVWGYLYAAQHPEKVSCLVAVDGGGNLPTRAEARKRTTPAAPHVSFASPEEAVTYAKTRWHTDPSVDAVVSESIRHGARKLDDGRWGWCQDPAAVAVTDKLVFMPTREELESALPRIKCPTLIVRGSEGAVSREVADRVAHLIPNGSWVEVPNAGHVVHLANPGGFLAAVRDLLEPKTASGSDCNQPASTALTTVALPGHPFSIVSTHDGCSLFVSLTSDDPKANGVAVLRRAAGAISFERVYPIDARKGRNPLRPGPSGIVMTHDGKLLIAVNDDDLIFLDAQSMISGKPDPVVAHLNDGAPKHTVLTSNGVTETSAGSFYLNVTKDDGFLFVSDEYASTISVIDLAKARHGNYDASAVVGRIPVGVAPIALTFSPDERWLYTTSHDASPSWNWPLACPQDQADRAAYTKLEKPEGAVVVVDVARARTDPAHSVAAKVPAGCGSVRLAIAPDGGSIWVSARRSDAVLGFDTRKLMNDPLHARLGSVPVGTAPVGISVLPDGKHLVVANSNRIAANPNSPQTIGVIDIEKVRAGAPAVIGTFPAGAFPREFSLSPDGRTLFLGNYLSNTLQVIDLKRFFDIVQASDGKAAGEAGAQHNYVFSPFKDSNAASW